MNSALFGLSKERPILGHHAKAHILKSGGFHVKSKDHLQGIVTLCFYFLRVGFEDHNAQAREDDVASTLALKPISRVNCSPQQRDQWLHKNRDLSPQFSLKKKEITHASPSAHALGSSLAIF